MAQLGAEVIRIDPVGGAIDYNRWPAVPGKGSAFFLHVTNGAPTAGCVAVPQASLLAIMKWLNPAARPLISIGVG